MLSEHSRSHFGFNRGQPVPQRPLWSNRLSRILAVQRGRYSSSGPPPYSMDGLTIYTPALERPLPGCGLMARPAI